ncbi:MAG: hypothetical protein MI723_16905, partial [Caulobacterales bacterium]|nr:hypothetical protein [Caulobacterales bacterium]
MSIRHGVDNGADAGLTDGDAPDPAPATPKKRRSTTYPESFTPHVEGVDYGILDTLLGYAIRRSQIRVYSDFYREIGDQ